MGKKYFKHPFEKLMEKGRHNNWPIFVHFDLTYNCNLECIHCYVVKQQRKELSFSEVRNILHDLARYNAFLLTLSGGEIFCREDICGILREAKKLNFRIVIFSNGTLITPRIARILRENTVAEVQISIYGVTADKHNAVTAKAGSFERAMETIKLLKEQKVRVVLKILVMGKNYSEYRKIKGLADTLEVDYLFGPFVYPRMNFDKKVTELSLSTSQLEGLYLDDVALKNDLEPIKRNAEDFELGPKLNQPICGAGRNRCYISPYGDVYPCPTLWVKVGDIRESSFREIWENSPLLNKIRKSRLKDMKECCNCELLPYCDPCPGMNFQGTRTLTEPYELHCRAAEAKYNAIRKRYY